MFVTESSSLFDGGNQVTFVSSEVVLSVNPLPRLCLIVARQRVFEKLCPLGSITEPNLGNDRTFFEVNDELGFCFGWVPGFFRR